MCTLCILTANITYRVTSNLTDVSNYSDTVMNYFLTSNLVVYVNSLEYFLLLLYGQRNTYYSYYSKGVHGIVKQRNIQRSAWKSAIALTSMCLVNWPLPFPSRNDFKVSLHLQLQLRTIFQFLGHCICY